MGTYEALALAGRVSELSIGQIRGYVAFRILHNVLYLTPPPFVIPPPATPPPLGGNGHLVQKAQKILGVKGAKENCYKAPNAPKLIYTVILWCSLGVQSPPPPRGGTITTLVGRLPGG